MIPEDLAPADPHAFTPEPAPDYDELPIPFALVDQDEPIPFALTEKGRWA